MSDETRKAIQFLRDQADVYQAVHDTAPLSSVGEHHAICALRAEARRLESLSGATHDR